MRSGLIGLSLLPVVAVAALVGPPSVRGATARNDAPLTALWEPPTDLATRDLFNGPWGQAHAPDPDAVYTFVRPKSGGYNPGLIASDPHGREWHVKQGPRGHSGNEGPVEVVVSRVLSAVGYHQPPVYFLPSFKLTGASGTHVEPGGRFRLHDGSMQGQGEWSWQRNPFVGTRPYHGLLVMLLMFNSFDLKNSNNTLYDVRRPDGRLEQWYVVRDLGAAFGDSGHLAPVRNDPDRFERQTFITGVKGGFVRFSYHGWQPELFRDRITPEDVGWASALLSQLSDRQWRDAFRAGGYEPAVAERLLRKLRANITQGAQIARDHGTIASTGR